MRNDETQTDLGIIKIHKNVIASISALAANEVDGVKRIGGNLKSKLLELIGKSSLSCIKVEIEKNEEINLEIPVIIKYGFNIPDVSDKVQQNVRSALEKMTRLSVKNININVCGIEKI